MKLVKFCLTALQSSVFEKVREFIGVIKYAFAAQQLTEPCGWHFVKKTKFSKIKTSICLKPMPAILVIYANYE